MKHVNRRLATQAMDHARAQAASGDLAAARAAMRACEQQLRSSPEHRMGCTLTTGLLADLEDAQESMRGAHDFRAVGSKKLALLSNMHGKQRACSYRRSAATEMYAGSAQRQMKACFGAAVR